METMAGLYNQADLENLINSLPQELKGLYKIKKTSIFYLYRDVDWEDILVKKWNSEIAGYIQRLIEVYNNKKLQQIWLTQIMNKLRN